MDRCKSMNIPNTIRSSIITTRLTLVKGVTGTHIQAHGPGIIKVDSTYYLIGEDKSKGSSFQNVNCYSSINLVEWNFAGALLSRTSSGDLGPNRVVERPKVLYNKATRKYVLFMHIDDSSYKEAKVGVATGDSVCGKFNYVGSYRPMGNQNRDMGVFQDDDGTGYLLSEDVGIPNKPSVYSLAHP
jgi:beta-xylosidase